MPYGFLGKASEKCFEELADFLAVAEKAHNHKPFIGCYCPVVPPPALPEPVNEPPPYDLADVKSGGHTTGVGNKTNIAADQRLYTDILNYIRETDAKAFTELYDVMLQINELCETDYILPLAQRRYLSIMNYVKDSLVEFLQLTNNAEVKINNFVEEIIDIG